MKWLRETETDIEKIPPFVRNKVRSAVENYARENNISLIDRAVLSEAKSALFAGIKPAGKIAEPTPKKSETVKVEICKGKERECPFIINDIEKLKKNIEEILICLDFDAKRKKQIPGMILAHHIFTIGISGCPNACSQPQIKDIGIISRVIQEQSTAGCTACKACVNVCPEGGISLNENEDGVLFDSKLCIRCGMCITACPLELIKPTNKGYSLLAGGKLGRHPQLAHELNEFIPAEDILQPITKLLEYFLEHSQGPEKMAALMNRKGPETLSRILNQ